jgi:hypothetical protein
MKNTGTFKEGPVSPWVLQYFDKMRHPEWRPSVHVVSVVGERVTEPVLDGETWFLIVNDVNEFAFLYDGGNRYAKVYRDRRNEGYVYYLPLEKDVMSLTTGDRDMLRKIVDYFMEKTA